MLKDSDTIKGVINCVCDICEDILAGAEPRSVPDRWKYFTVCMNCKRELKALIEAKKKLQ